MTTDQQWVEFLQWALPQLRLRWPGFRKVRRQVHKRIKGRIRQLGLWELSQYRAYLTSHPAEWPVLDGFCRISISRFYRDHRVFEYLGDEILPELAQAAIDRGENELRLWCAGCASGEEAYTWAILCSRHVAPRFPQLRLRLLATDVDEHLLQRARQASYRRSSLNEVPRDWLDTAFTRCGDQYVLRAESAAAIEFRRHDVRDEPPAGPLHLVSCRNLVFTYFDEDLQRETLRRIAGRMAPNGVLVIGKHESLPMGTEEFSPCRGKLGVYRKRE